MQLIRWAVSVFTEFLSYVLGFWSYVINTTACFTYACTHAYTHHAQVVGEFEEGSSNDFSHATIVPLIHITFSFYSKTALKPLKIHI